MNGSMQLINFNLEEFEGFEENEEILLDTGIILAYLNKYDAWHTTIKNLFENHIFNNEKVMFLFVNPCMVNEVAFLSERPLENFSKKNKGMRFSKEEKAKVKKQTLNTLEQLIENEVLLVLDGDKSSVLKQIQLSEKLGPADAVNASLAHEYGINFLTVDKRLALNIKENENELKDIPKVYYTTYEHRDY